MRVKFSSPFRVFAALCRSLYAQARGYEILSSSAVEADRLGLCFACDQYDEPDEQCRKCGCLVRAKVLLATEKCPIGKWKRVWLRKAPKAGTV